MDDTSNFPIGCWCKIVNIYVGHEGLRSTSAFQINEPNLAADNWTKSKRNLPLKDKNAHNRLFFFSSSVFMSAFTGVPVSINLLAEKLYQQKWISYTRTPIKMLNTSRSLSWCTLSWHIEWTAISPCFFFFFQIRGQLKFKTIL